MYTGECTLRCEVRRRGIHGLCIPVDSFDQRCESEVLHYVVEMGLVHLLVFPPVFRDQPIMPA